MYDFAYQKPGSLAEAVKALSADGDARPLAGGMIVFTPDIQRGGENPLTSGAADDAHPRDCRGAAQRFSGGGESRMGQRTLIWSAVRKWSPKKKERGGPLGHPRSSSASVPDRHLPCCR